MTGKPSTNLQTTPGNTDNPQRSHDLFQDPALASSLQDDPVAKFIVSNWKSLVVVILALIGGFYLRSQIRSTTDVRVQESSETFDKARSSLVELLDIQQKTLKDKVAAAKDPAATPAADVEAANKEKSDKLLRAVKDSLSALKSGPEPYTLLVPLYENILQQLEAQNLNSSSALAATQAVAWQESTSPTNRLVLEMQELLAARALIDSDQTFKNGVTRLQKLASESEYVRASAVLTLLRVVNTEEDKSAAVSAAQDVVRLYPEEAEKIEAELKRF